MSDAAQPEERPEAEATPGSTAKPASRALARIDHVYFDSRDGAFTGVDTKAPETRRDWRRLGAALSLSLVVAVGAAVAVAHLRAQGVETTTLAQRMDQMSSRLESVEATRVRDEIANLRKLLAEIKAGAASTRDMSGAVGQLAARVDKLEKEQGARLDKLAERIDHDSAQRLGDVTARLDKLEAKTAVAAAPAKPSPDLKTAAKPEGGVSNETTGAIARAPAKLRGFYLSEVRDGLALIYGPGGEFAIGPGESAPGLGRVLKIERRGREWAVVTTQGQITAEDD